MPNDYNSAIDSWNNLLNVFQNSIIRRKAMIGDGNGNVRVDGKPGWNWVRYDYDSSKISMVRNLILGHLGEGTPVWIGRAEPQDSFEQVLGIYWGPYSWTISQAVLDQYATAPHGDTHHGATGNDPAPIVLENMANGKIIATDPESLYVNAQAFFYARGYSMIAFGGGGIDLSSYVPLVAGHRYTLVYMNISDGSLGAIAGAIAPDPMTPDIPASLADTVPLGVVNMYFGMTEIYDRPDIYQCKILWGSIGGNTNIHTHTDDTSGGTSIIGIEELMLSCAEPIFMDGSMLVPVNVYHEIYIPTMYAGAWPSLEADLTWIVPDNVYGCGQLLLLRVADPGMYTSYKITLRHGVGNLWFHDESDIVLDRGTDHVLLVYDGTSWCDILSSGSNRVSDPVRIYTDYTVLFGDSLIVVDAAGGDVTVTLPPAASVIGRSYRIKRVDASANTVTIQADGAETIDDLNSQTILQYDCMEIESDRTEWWIV